MKVHMQIIYGYVYFVTTMLPMTSMRDTKISLLHFFNNNISTLCTITSKLFEKRLSKSTCGCTMYVSIELWTTVLRAWLMMSACFETGKNFAVTFHIFYARKSPRSSKYRQFDRLWSLFVSWCTYYDLELNTAKCAKSSVGIRTP